MKISKKILLIIIGIIGIGVLLFTLNFYTDNLGSNNNTLVITMCTGDMRGLEIGVSPYVGYKHMPLILSDDTLPNQLSNWLPSFIKKHNIKKIIVVGPLSGYQIFNLEQYGIPVQQIGGNSKSEILTNIAENTNDKNNSSIIITASDPQAGVLGAYTKTPVFITANNSTYNSAQHLDDHYKDYIITHRIKQVIIVGDLPNSLKNEIMQCNTTVEQLNGKNSVEISMSINNKLKNEGYINNTTTAYIGFYGEIAAVIPNIISDHAILIENPSSNTEQAIAYLNNSHIKNVVLTRNTPSQYLQMEEMDCIDENVIEQLNNSNISIEQLVQNRTLDETTGLYDVKINAAERLYGVTENNGYKNINNNTKFETSEYPPLIQILQDNTKWQDSNNITVFITQNNNSTYIVQWNTIHPYKWVKISDTYYNVKSDNGYEYRWIKNNNTWYVYYKYNNYTYYTAKWTKNNDSTWTEQQRDYKYNWLYYNKEWFCISNNNSTIVYTLTKMGN